MFTIARYVRDAVDPAAPMNFAWDEEDPLDHYDREDARQYKRLTPMSKRAIVALAAGCAEWIDWRLYGESLEPLVLRYLEATWAGLVDWAYIDPEMLLDLGDTTGKVRGPLYACMDTLNDIVRFTYNGDWGRTETVHLYFLARHVLPKPKVFTAWFDMAVERLCKFYPKPSQEWGDPVPRQVLDPNVDFQPEKARDMFTDFLKGLDPAENPLLKKPEEMVKNGFKGTPYTW